MSSNRYDWNPPGEDLESLRAWFERWGECVAARDFETARPLFSPDVAGFGTRMEVVQGLDALVDKQWRRVWPTIADFRFATGRLRAAVSPDRRLALGLCLWSSRGFHQDGRPFERPGRATLGFARDAVAAPWIAIHSHISLAPGTPQRSFGLASRP